MRLTTSIMALMAASQIVYAEVNTDEFNFILRMDKNIEYVDSHQDAVWPGFRISNTPTVFSIYGQGNDSNDMETHIYGLNLTPMQLPWEVLPLNNHNVYYLDHEIENDDLMFYDGKMHDVDSQKSFIDFDFKSFLRVEQNFYDLFTIKRAAYYIYNESKIDKKHLGNLSASYDSFYQPEQMKLLYLEDAALTASLQDKGDQAEAELQDAVAIHQYRQSLINKEFKAYEHANEIFTGLPFYISAKSMNMSDDNYIKKTQLTGCPPFSIKVGMFGIMACAISGMSNFASTTYGRALEQHLSSNGWKTAVETEFKSPSRILQEYYQFSDAKAKTLAQSAMNKSRYDYARISRTVEQIIPPYVKEMKAAQDAYTNQPGVELYTDWELNYVMAIVGSMFGSSDNYYINTNTLLTSHLTGLVYTTEHNVEFNYKDIPYGYTSLKYDELHNIDSDNSWSIFKLSPDTAIAIDGNKDTIGNFVQSGKKVEFRNLLIDDPLMTITIKSTKGTLDASEGKLKLRFEMDPFIKTQSVNLMTLINDRSPIKAPVIKSLNGQCFKILGLIAERR